MKLGPKRWTSVMMQYLDTVYKINRSKYASENVLSRQKMMLPLPDSMLLDSAVVDVDKSSNLKKDFTRIK